MKNYVKPVAEFVEFATEKITTSVEDGYNTELEE